MGENNNIPVLEAKHLGIQFGGLKAVDDFNLKIGKSELIGLIGPNGAGKTTVFNLLTGVYQTTSGAYYLFGHDELERFRPSPNPQASAGKYPHSHPCPLRFSG